MYAGPLHRVARRSRRRPRRPGSLEFLLRRGLARMSWSVRPEGGTQASCSAAFHLLHGTAHRPSWRPSIGSRAHVARCSAEFLCQRGLARAGVAQSGPARGFAGTRAARIQGAEAEGADPCGSSTPAPAPLGSANFLVARGLARAPGRAGTSRQVAGMPRAGLFPSGAGRVATAAEGVRRSGLDMPTGTVPEPGVVSAAVGDPGPLPGGGTLWYDAHAHIVAPSRDDWYGIGVGATKLAWAVRVAYLRSFRSAHGFAHMVISAGPEDRHAPSAMHNSDDLNAVTWATWQEDPDYFVPLCVLSDQELRGPGVMSPATKLANQFALHDWRGIGEIFVHSETVSLDRTYNTVLFELCELAANEGVPIVFHWSFGHRDNADDPFTAEANFEQLIDLLDKIVAELSIRPTVIIAHCGLGPGLLENSGRPFGRFEFELDEWADRLQQILETADYDFVKFDLAGMQTGQNQQLLALGGVSTTPAGAVILGFIDGSRLGIRHPDRFLFGTDAQKRVDAANIASFLPGYDSFLDLSVSLGKAAKAQVRWANAARTF